MASGPYLPPEIIDEILSYFGDPGLPQNRSMLCALRLVSRTFHKSCTKALFSVINIQPSIERSLPQMTVLRTSGLHHYIRRLYISTMSAVNAWMLKDGGNRVLAGCRDQEGLDGNTPIDNPVGPDGSAFNTTLGRNLQTFGSALAQFFMGFGQCELQRLTLDIRCRMLNTTSNRDGVASHPFSHELTNRFLKTFWMTMSLTNQFYLNTLKIKTNSWYMENKWIEVCHVGSFRRIKNFDFELSTRDQKAAVINLEYPIFSTQNTYEPTPILSRMSLNCHRHPLPCLFISPPASDSTSGLRRLELQGFSLESKEIKDALARLINLEHLLLSSVWIMVRWDQLDLMRSGRNFEGYRPVLPLWGNVFRIAAIYCPKLLQLDFVDIGYYPNRQFSDFPNVAVRNTDVDELNTLFGVVNSRRSQEKLAALRIPDHCMEYQNKRFWK